MNRTGIWKWLQGIGHRRHRANLERVLGTSLELQFVTNRRRAGSLAEARALAEIDRLERIFSAYSGRSEFRIWQERQDKQDLDNRKDLDERQDRHTPDTDNTGLEISEVAYGAGCVADEVSSELAAVMEAAEKWRQRTGGAFHPGVEALTRLWAGWATRGRVDAGVESGSVDETGISPINLVRLLQGSLWQVYREEGRSFVRRKTAVPATLNSIAKGYIIDGACEQAKQTQGIVEALVNIGGDLRHMGTEPVAVAITNPFLVADNAPPVAVVRICNQGLATSGNYRRGFRIGERWYSHLIDPRTGQPVDHVVSASVIAPNAMQADVLATAFSVLTPIESLRFADTLPDVGLLLISDTGEIDTNAFWRLHAVDNTH